MKNVVEQPNPWKTHSEKLIYESPWVRVYHHECTNPAGKPASYSVVRFQHLALGILAIDAHENIWLVGQWRYPIGQYSWEIPEGGGRINEEPLEEAKRELKEETGLTARKWRELFRMHLSNSATDELAILFLAEELTLHEAQPDETEVLQVKKVPLRQAMDWVKKGIITDSLSVAGILYVCYERKIY